MKTLCYKSIFRCKGWLYNEGFVIVEIDNGELKSLEGMLTNDYLEGKIENEKLRISIFTLDNKGKYKEEFIFLIALEVIQFPFSIHKKDKDGNEYEMIFEGRPNNSLEFCKKMLKRFKSHNVFERE